MRRLAPVIISVFTAVVLIAAPAQAEGHGGWHRINTNPNNVVTVVSEQNGGFRYDTGVGVTTNPSDTIDNQNSATAEGVNCTGCRTVAVAVQVVIEETNAHTVIPQNAAVAVNYQCTNCQTFAYANQILVTAGRPVQLSQDGWEHARELQGWITVVAASNEDFGTMSSQLNWLSDELAKVVKDDIQQQQGGDHQTTEHRSADARY